MASPDRILRQRDVTAMAALDTMPAIIDRVRNLLAHGRRISIARRYTYVDTPPEVKVGLTVGEINTWAKADSAGIGVRLSPGIEGFGIGAHAGEADTEREVWKRYHAAESVSDDWFKRRQDMTRVDITGGLPGNGPARDDQLVIRAWNRDGVCDERVIAFDYGPDRQQQREDLARHLWIADAGNPGKWDALAYTDDELRAPFLRRADEILAVIAGKDEQPVTDRR